MEIDFDPSHFQHVFVELKNVHQKNIDIIRKTIEADLYSVLQDNAWLEEQGLKPSLKIHKAEYVHVNQTPIEKKRKKKEYNRARNLDPKYREKRALLNTSEEAVKRRKLMNESPEYKEQKSFTQKVRRRMLHIVQERQEEEMEALPIELVRDLARQQVAKKIVQEIHPQFTTQEVEKDAIAFLQEMKARKEQQKKERYARMKKKNKDQVL